MDGVEEEKLLPTLSAIVLRCYSAMVFLCMTMSSTSHAEDATSFLQNYSTIAHSHCSTASNHSTIAPSHRSTVLIFVSFSLNDTVLKQYALETKKAGASLVLRGLVNNSMKETVARLQPIVQETQASFLIDPNAFRKFGIEEVPAVVVTTGNESSAFDVLYGLTTLDYALQSIAQKGETAATAQEALKRLRGSL